MKPTGIIRRVDNLGRIVLPITVRNTLKIEEGEPMELFYDEGEQMVILKKYRPGRKEN